MFIAILEFLSSSPQEVSVSAICKVRNRLTSFLSAEESHCIGDQIKKLHCTANNCQGNIQPVYSATFKTFKKPFKKKNRTMWNNLQSFVWNHLTNEPELMTNNEGENVHQSTFPLMHSGLASSCFLSNSYVRPLHLPSPLRHISSLGAFRTSSRCLSISHSHTSSPTRGQLWTECSPTTRSSSPLLCCFLPTPPALSASLIQQLVQQNPSRLWRLWRWLSFSCSALSHFLKNHFIFQLLSLYETLH